MWQYWRLTAVIAAVLVHIPVALPGEVSDQLNEKASWAVDPAIPGPVLPPTGRSLFDFVAADGIPFPFETLVRKIEARAGCKPGGCTTPVLIPLGRSLQRTAAAPDFFAYPRAVVAMTGEGKGPIFARDRLYLAYQERMNLIEVISYNEQAARFEFQLVRDYREGGSPNVVYANRNVCIACHQNHSPIFPRPVWDETNANPGIAKKLSQAGRPFYGIPLNRGIDIPNMIDEATDRANLIGVTQVIWREACDQDCRALAITAALRYRLSGGRFSDLSSFEEALVGRFAARWPNGLAIPNPDIPNRDPLSFPTGSQGATSPHIAAVFDALAPRAPLQVWTACDPLLARRFVVGLADLLAEKDLHDLNASLARLATHATRQTSAAPCTFTQTRYDCEGVFTLHGSTDFIEALAVSGESPLHFTLANGVPVHAGFQARTSEGDLIEKVTVIHKHGKAKATVYIVEDFVYVRETIRKFTWPDAPVNRGLIRVALGLDTPESCCETPGFSLGPARAEIETPGPVPKPGTAFEKACAACHRTSGRFPPNFLAGDESQVSASLAQCAPRIFLRLSMWETPADSRDKIPMPPPLASRKGHPWVQTLSSPSVAMLRDTVAEWLRAETGQMPDAAAMVAHGYENLRPCLPDRNSDRSGTVRKNQQ
jgi:hypothetical protein